MLSRGNSEASARLRRAKSSASIKTRRSLPTEPDVPDPSVAKEQALAAAYHAYGRANAFEVASGASFDTISQHRALHAEQPLTRSKSIRFAGPTALPGHGIPITMREAPPTPLEHETRRRSLHPRLRQQISSTQDEDASMTALPSHDEYVETRVASQPSSYRRLRKSKSMFSSGLWTNATASIAPRNSTHHAPEHTGQQADSRLGRSLSFLRPSTERSQSQVTVSKAAQSEAVGLARDHYFRHLEHQKSNNQPSNGNLLKRRQSQKAFRRSVRTGSGNSYGSAVGSPASSTAIQTERKGIGGRARDLSSTFKNRFKRVFNRTSEEGAIFPAQQLRATRPHFGDPATPYAPSSLQNPPTDSPHNIELGSSGLERGDNLHVPRRRSSLAGSLHTTDGELNDETAQSRVTSWTNSTATNTISSQRGPGQKRLSIIQETGGVLSQPSSLQQAEAGSQSQSRKTGLYAKLHQKMAKSNRISQYDPPHDNVADTISHLFTGPEILSSSCCHKPETRSRLPSDHYRPGSLKSVTLDQDSSANVPQHGATSQGASTVQTETLRGDAREPSPKRPLRESKSMFFPQSTRIERSSTSPFRQAMQSSGHSDKRLGMALTSSPVGRSEKVSYLLAPNGNRDRSLTRSESIYSRTSSGDTPQPLGSSASLTQTETGWEKYIPTIPSKINLEDRLRASAAETGRARETGHKREHAEISGVDTNIGRLHLSTPMLKDFSASPRIGAEFRPSPRHASSQPMLDRFPLMSISPQNKSNNVQHKPLDKPKTVIANARENENRPPTSHPEKGTENSNSQWLGPDLTSSRNYTKEAIRQSTTKNGLYATPVKTNTLPTSTPTPHSRSSPERIARLRRSNYPKGSPSLRKETGISPSPRLLTHEPVIYQNRPPPRDEDMYKGGLPRDAVDPDSGGRKMVDLFLSNRRESPSNVGDDTVFI
ncbi:MAG: hypothetical protein Q9171_003093 [Xanthocarpia ochracea]